MACNKLNVFVHGVEVLFPRLRKLFDKGKSSVMVTICSKGEMKLMDSEGSMAKSILNRSWEIPNVVGVFTSDVRYDDVREAVNNRVRELCQK